MLTLLSRTFFVPMSDSPRTPLPFEPNKKPKKKVAPNASESPSSKAKAMIEPKAGRSTPTPSPDATPTSPLSRAQLMAKKIDIKPKPRQPASGSSSRSTQIPEAVNRRMLARMGAFSGTPSILGVLVLVSSYFVITKEWFPLPSVAVLLVSMGCFGLGVVGLTYGALSASWDLEDEGSPLGWTEFQTNLGRLRQGWREAKAEAQRQNNDQ